MSENTTKTKLLGIKGDEKKPRLELLPPSYWTWPPAFELSYWLCMWHRHQAGLVKIDCWDPVGSFPRIDLLDCLKGMEYGADKYGDFNWTLGIHPNRYVGAFLRHTHVFQNGLWARRQDLHEIDEESGNPHSQHAAACYYMLKSTVYGGWVS